MKQLDKINRFLGSTSLRPPPLNTFIMVASFHLFFAFFQENELDIFLSFDATLPLFFLYFLLYTFIHTQSFNRFICHTVCSTLFFLIAVCSAEGLHWGAEPRIGATSQLPGPTRYRLSHAAPVWATPHPKLDILFIYVNEKKFIIDMK
jgi:hypothetical protein